MFTATLLKDPGGSNMPPKHFLTHHGAVNCANLVTSERHGVWLTLVLPSLVSRFDPRFFQSPAQQEMSMSAMSRTFTNATRELPTAWGMSLTTIPQHMSYIWSLGLPCLIAAQGPLRMANAHDTNFITYSYSCGQERYPIVWRTSQAWSLQHHHPLRSRIWQQDNQQPGQTGLHFPQWTLIKPAKLQIMRFETLHTWKTRRKKICS